MMNKYLLILLLGIVLSSCEVLEQMGTAIDEAGAVTGSLPLTEEEVVSGLKEALRVGTDTAVSVVSAADGFYGDALIKILLPPEAGIITKNLDNPVLKSLGISAMVDDVVLRMNRSAEEASKKAGPIFMAAIKNMSIADAWSILRGDDTAATHYFRINTSKALYQEFKPVVNEYLNQKIVGSVSANDAWSSLTKVYNQAAQFSSSLTPVNTRLDDYVTRKTIDGLFVKLAAEEKQIREDPAARVTDILKRVFGH